ncbi:MAG: HAMP domain-containing histidine kinase [Acidobacteria bacterium]|nr:HAMP domain-containing histidine kinase [Acidobacteriota bacterium]
MRRQGPITMRHVVVAVLVVVVINAQLTWWIVVILRLNRTILEFERERLLGAAQSQAVRVENDLRTARTALEAAVMMGDEPGRNQVPAPFVGWRAAFAVEQCPPTHMGPSGVVEISFQSGLRCVTAVIGGDWGQAVFDVGELLEVTTTGEEGPPGVALAEPFDGLTVRPRIEVWAAVLEDYQDRIVMVVLESLFFAVLMLVLIGLLWRSFRREVELERQHRNFLSAVTHELKSPLATMRLVLETVISGRADPETGAKFLGNALVDVERLENLVEKILEATRFGEGSTPIRRQEEDLSRLIEDSIEDFKRRALAEGAHLRTEISPGIHADLDAEAMTIVVSNLLENAVNYGGDPPTVEIDLSFDGSRAVLEVSDNGTGISKDDLPSVFRRFFRGGDEMTRTTKGTGLGLYLVQQIVAAHRGKVEVASTGPDGSNFRVTLPAHY